MESGGSMHPQSPSVGKNGYAVNKVEEPNTHKICPINRKHIKNVFSVRVSKLQTAFRK